MLCQTNWACMPVDKAGTLTDRLHKTCILDQQGWFLQLGKIGLGYDKGGGRGRKQSLPHVNMRYIQYTTCTNVLNMNS